jgi:Holliday junction resolvase
VSAALGKQRELHVRNWLAERDWVVIHTRPGTNFCDIVAIKPGEPTRFVEVKSTAGGPYEKFRKQDRADLIAISDRAGAQAWLAWWPPRGSLRWIHWTEFPGVATREPLKLVPP